MSINYRKTLCFSFVIVILLLCGCVLKYEDVSNEPKYMTLLNTCYSLKTKMLISGVNLPPGYGKDIDIYIVSPVTPKVVGREIITEDILEPETTFKIQNIRRSINNIPGYQSIQAVVAVSTFAKPINLPIVIDLKYILSTNYIQEKPRKNWCNTKE